MPRISNSTLFLVVVLSLIGFTVYRSGWIPLELGGAATGSVLELDTPQPEVDSPPEFAEDDSSQLEVGGSSSALLAEEAEPLNDPEPPRRGGSVRLIALDEPAIEKQPAVEKKVETPATEAETASELIRSCRFALRNEPRNKNRHSTSARSTVRSKLDKSSKLTKPCRSCSGNSPISVPACKSGSI